MISAILRVKKKFDNSIIRDKKDYSATFRVKKQFANSKIRDKGEKIGTKKIRDLRDTPCEEQIEAPFE